MSFPHRTAFYGRDENRIIYPEDVGKVGGYENPIVAHPEGKGVFFSYKSKKFDGSRFIPLTSTGLEDSENNEIFEGHLLYDGESYAVVVWSHGQFLITFDLGEGFATELLTETYSLETIKGHALTSSDLVPDSFDVEGYFN
jgi:hypothetical protein